jgi:hypothetical protein
MCNQSAPASIIRFASVARLAKSDDSMEGAIIALPVLGAVLAILKKSLLLCAESVGRESNPTILRMERIIGTCCFV